jgi:hypothetical protein
VTGHTPDETGGMPVDWTCGGCGELTTVRHWLQRGGVMAHDPEAAMREAAGLDAPEPLPADCNQERPPFMFAVPSGLTETDDDPLTVSPELHKRIEEMNRVRDRGAAAGANYFIGGAS